MAITKWFLLIVAGVILGALAWVAGSFSVTSDQSLTPPPKNQRIIELENEIVNLKQAIAAFKKRSFTSGAAVATNQIRNNQGASASYPAAPAGSVPNTYIYPVSNAANPVNNVQQPYIFKLVSSFNEEEVDEKWAIESKKKLQDMLAVDSSLLGVEVEKIECKATICRIKIKIRHDAELERVDFADKLSMAIMVGQKGSFEASVMSAHSKADNTLEFYFGKGEVSK